VGAVVVMCGGGGGGRKGGGRRGVPCIDAMRSAAAVGDGGSVAACVEPWRCCHLCTVRTHATTASCH